MSAAQISPDCTVFAQLFPTIEGQPYTVAKCCTKQDPYVVCDNQKRITSIILKNVDVVGSLSSDLEKLDALTFIDISNNKITGSLPASIGKLSNLEKLYLNNNQLTGTIPEEFGKLQKLKEINVSNNQLNPPVPVGVLNLPNYNSNNFQFGFSDTDTGTINPFNNPVGWIKSQDFVKKLNLTDIQLIGIGSGIVALFLLLIICCCCCCCCCRRRKNKQNNELNEKNLHSNVPPSPRSAFSFVRDPEGIDTDITVTATPPSPIMHSDVVGVKNSPLVNTPTLPIEKIDIPGQSPPKAGERAIPVSGGPVVQPDLTRQAPNTPPVEIPMTNHPRYSIDNVPSFDRPLRLVTPPVPFNNENGFNPELDFEVPVPPAHTHANRYSFDNQFYQENRPGLEEPKRYSLDAYNHGHRDSRFIDPVTYERFENQPYQQPLTDNLQPNPINNDYNQQQDPRVMNDQQQLENALINENDFDPQVYHPPRELENAYDIQRPANSHYEFFNSNEQYQPGYLPEREWKQQHKRMSYDTFVPRRIASISESTKPVPKRQSIDTIQKDSSVVDGFAQQLLEELKHLSFDSHIDKPPVMEPKSIFVPGKTPFRPGPIIRETTTPPSSNTQLNSIDSINQLESGGPIFFFSNISIEGSFMEYVHHLYLPLNIEVKASSGHIPYSEAELNVTRGDSLIIRYHTFDGWCTGENLTSGQIGRIPVYCVSPLHKVKLNMVYCYANHSLSSPTIPREIDYIQNVFPNFLTIHMIDLSALEESSLYPVFGTLNGNERCFIQGDVQFVNFMELFLQDFGKAFWKHLEIVRVSS